MVKLWVRHWVTLTSRPFPRLRETEFPVLLVSVEKHSLGERQVPVMAKPEFRHYMSNIFVYFMRESVDAEKGLAHNWEIKLGIPLEEAKELAGDFLEAIKLCEKRREERHKKQLCEE